MYWIYLTIFTFIVFVPTFVQKGLYGFNAVQTQEFFILFLGSIGFFLFLIQERLAKRNALEKTKIQKQVNRMNKDLNNSYTYIGEINRKLDILENIALGFPESSNLSAKKQAATYEVIMSAVQLFAKSDDFTLRFVTLPNYEIVKEVQSRPNLRINFSFKDYDPNKHFFETEDYIAATSPKAIDNVFACLIIKKQASHQVIEDAEIIKTLAAQALFIFMFTRRKKQLKCVL